MSKASETRKRNQEQKARMELVSAAVGSGHVSCASAIWPAIRCLLRTLSLCKGVTTMDKNLLATIRKVAASQLTLEQVRDWLENKGHDSVTVADICSTIDLYRKG